MNCIEPTDFCVLPHESDLSCPGQYSYKDQSLCSINKYKFQKFKMWNFLLNQVNNKRLIAQMFNDYQRFISNIKICQSNEAPIEKIQNNNICLKKHDCFAETGVSTPIRTMFTFRKKSCSCLKGFSYSCSDYFCAFDKKSCESLIKSSNRSNYLYEIKPCKY